MSDLEQRFAEALEKLARQEAQIAALTRRVFVLERGVAPPPAINEQPLVEVEVEKVAAAAEPDWEARFGTNWLNRAGVLILVIGVALFLGYAMTSLGPWGKISIGGGVGLALLALGYWFEEKGNFRPFSLGLIAGGFAILYATSYAAHAVETSRIISNAYAGVAIQTVIAAAAIWQAAKFGNERAAMLAFLAAYWGLLAGGSKPYLSLGALPLTLSGLWLADRMNWRALPWTLLAYSWYCVYGSEQLDWNSRFWGKPFAWANLFVFAAFEIRERIREWRPLSALMVCANAALFLLTTFHGDALTDDPRLASIFGLLGLAGLLSSAVRWRSGARHEAASEALTVAGASFWALFHFGVGHPLNVLMICLGFAMLGLLWNRQAPAAALTLAAEGLLALVVFIMLFVFPESKMLSDNWLRIHEGLPQMVALTVCLFAAGRWLSATPWPSGAALVCVAVITLVTIPKTMGTVVLALEAILVLAAGFALNRRPIRIGGLALFVFSILKVFVYDLNELSTLPRIFSFIVLGLLLIGASWAYTKYREELRKYL